VASKQLITQSITEYRMIIRRCAECVHRHCLTTQTQRLRLLCLTVACWAFVTYTFHAVVLGDGLAQQAQRQQDNYIDEVHKMANERMRQRAEELEKELQLVATNKEEEEQQQQQPPDDKTERLGDSVLNSTSMQENAQPATKDDQENLPNYQNSTTDIIEMRLRRQI